MLNLKFPGTCFFQRHEERVIIISSKDTENVISDAENALHQIANVILKVMCYVHYVLILIEYIAYNYHNFGTAKNDGSLHR